MVNMGTYDDGEEEDSLKCGATLKSRRGTVRGVKNRVRQGIATFLKDKSKKVGVKDTRCVYFLGSSGRTILYNECMKV